MTHHLTSSSGVATMDLLEHTPWRKASKLCAPFLVEFLGTFFLVFSVCMNATQGTIFAPFAIGITLMVSVFFGGHISGGHYNPAVTTAVAITRRGKISILTALIYIAVQVLASIAAAFVVWGILGETFHPAPGENVKEIRAVVAEGVWTFLLATVVLQTGTTATQAGNSFFGLAIGFTVLAGVIGVGPVSGGVFNPAVGTGPTIVDAIHNGKDMFKHIWIYWVGPLMGGAVAGAVFWFTNYNTEFLPNYENKEEPHSLFTPESVPTLGDRTAEVSKVTKKFEKRLENRLLHPHEKSVEKSFASSSSDEEALSDDSSINAEHDSLLKGEGRKKHKKERVQSLYGGGHLPSLADRTAEASQNTKAFAKGLI